jgi:hypothetical protein
MSFNRFVRVASGSLRSAGIATSTSGWRARRQLLDLHAEAFGKVRALFSECLTQELALLRSQFRILVDQHCADEELGPRGVGRRPSQVRQRRTLAIVEREVGPRSRIHGAGRQRKP